MVSSGDDYHGICMKMLEQLPWFKMIDERNINDSIIVIEIFINEIFHRAMFSYDRQLAAAIFENAVNLMKRYDDITFSNLTSSLSLSSILLLYLSFIASFSSFNERARALYLIRVLFLCVYVTIKTWTFRIINVIFAFIRFYIVKSIHIAHIIHKNTITFAHGFSVSIRRTVLSR